MKKQVSRAEKLTRAENLRRVLEAHNAQPEPLQSAFVDCFAEIAHAFEDGERGEDETGMPTGPRFTAAMNQWRAAQREYANRTE